MRCRARTENMRKLILLLLSLSLSVPSIAANPAVLPIRLHRGFLVVFDCAIPPLEKLACVLDTGAFRTVVDTEVANRLRLQSVPDEAFAAVRRVQVQRGELEQITFGTTTVRSLPVLVVDLTTFSNAVGAAIDAVVGIDVLRQHSVTIDYRKRELRFDETITADTSVALDPDSPYPLLPIRVGDDTLRLLLDTGADAISIFEGHVPASLRGADLMEASGTSAAGAVRARAIRAIDVQVGARKLARQTVFVVPVEVGFKAYDGHFGVRVLGTSWFHFDFSRRQISWGR
jgi:predicted aspartyl protease